MKKLCVLFVLCLPFCLYAQAPDLDTAGSLIRDSFDSLTVIESENGNLSGQLSELRSEMRNWSEASEAQKAEWMRQLETLNNRLHEAAAQQKKSEATLRRYKGLSIAGGVSTGGLLIALLLILLRCLA